MGLHHITIRTEAESLLSSFQKKYSIIQHYVPIDDITELHLGIDVYPVDFTKEYGENVARNIHGYIDFRKNAIVINDLHHPMNNDGRVGAYPFTMGHEV